MLEKEKVTSEARTKPQAGNGKTLVYLSVSFGRKPPHRETVQSVKVNSRLLAPKIK